MTIYILRRIAFFIPTLVVISLLTFYISVNSPGDPVELMLSRGEGSEGSQANRAARDKDYAELRSKLGFDLPLFYFSLTDATVPDTLHKIANPMHRAALKRLANEFGSWDHVAEYYLAVKDIRHAADIYDKDERRVLSELLFELEKFEINEKILTVIDSIGKIPIAEGSDLAGADVLVARMNLDNSDMRKSVHKLIADKNPYLKYIPAVHWYGFSNQYHRWLVNFLLGDFGISYQDKRNVSEKISNALPRTLGISLLSILIAYSIAIPLGVYSAVKKGTCKERVITTSLFILYSLPNFWIATVLVFFFCGGDYFAWFPDPNYMVPEEASFVQRFFLGLHMLILPLFCWTYGSLAFISRQMRGGILQNITQDYIQTARAKGADERTIIWKHVFKNSLLPVITLFGSIFPLAISGSFVIENIFNIPGMGKLTLDAFASRDYPIIFTVMMFTAILTMIGNLVSDVLYALVDPRISYSKKS